MYYAVTTDRGRITGVHESSFPITSGTFAESPLLAGQEVIPVDDVQRIRIEEGRYIDEYTEDWILKPLQQRVDEGIIVVPEGYVIDGEEIRAMTLQERIDAGLAEPPDEPVLIDERLQRIYQLKAELAKTDYMVIKCYEYSLAGMDPPYDIAMLHADRQAVRDDINALEEQE